MVSRLPELLYRRLRKEEVEVGTLLLPKAQTPFLELPRLPLTLPFDLGLRLDHAIRDHQRADLRPFTSGVSTTPLLERARWYGRDGSLPIVVLATSSFAGLGIVAHVVKDIIRPEYINQPKDEEVILTYSGGVAFPRACITQVISGTV